MKLAAFATLFSLAALAHAHDPHGAHARHAKRQAALQGTPSAPASSSHAASSGAPASSPSASPSPSVPAPAPPGNTPPPNAPVGQGDVPPLASITSGMPTGATLAPTATYTPGAKPPVTGAPPLPTTFVFNAADWPAQDKIPDTTSEQVKQWMKELDGFDIPDWKPTVDGSCASDPTAVSEASARGWWTCGGYLRSTDISACPTKFDWGVSFDDGPSPYTQKLLGYLTEQQILATFFVVGSRVIERPAVLLEEYMSGHEISVHTWSHKYLTTLTNEQIVAELGWTRKAIQTVLGVTPTTMRPPYGDIDDRVRAISLAMGMVPIIWTSGSGGPYDTNDWRVAGGMVTGIESFNTFESILGNASLLNTGFIVLQHDLFEITVDLAVGYTLNAAKTHQPPFSLKPIGKCMGIPTANLYLESNKNTSFPYTNHTSGSNSTGGKGGGGSKAADSQTTSAGAVGAALSGVLAAVAAVVHALAM